MSGGASSGPADRGPRRSEGAGAEREWVYDPRREARRQLARVPLPDDVEAHELDYDTRKELKALSKETAELVARHLVMAGRLMDDEPQQALAHARAARALAGRVGVVREANGLVAYTAGEWAEALSELRTARRLTGDPEHLAVMADCERALGRPDRALLIVEDPQAKSLSAAARVELMIVASGARRDQGHPEAAVVSLQVPALEGPVRAWTARLRYAYADALLDAGREDEARLWFGRCAEVDERGETDADERILQLDGMVFEDLYDEEDEPETVPATLLQSDESPFAPPAAEVTVPIEGSHQERVAASAGEPGEGKAEEPDPRASADAADVVPEREVRPEVPVAEVAVAELPVMQEPAASVPASGLGNVFQEIPVDEPPALGKSGSTGLGFVAPADAPEADEDAARNDDEPGGPEELRLFD